MAKYLYGASVQGIQSFIFQTNKLKEIVGASEIVKNITDKMFFDIADIDGEYKGLKLATAGNIKCEFSEEDKSKLEKIVREFPKRVMQEAPGITISQAVVEFEGEITNALTELEAKLKVQRNIPSVPLETGYSILKRARRTGGIVEKDNEDRATINKISKSDSHQLFKILLKKESLTEEEEKMLTKEFSDITLLSPNKWMAVVHADGNGLGNIIQNIGDELTRQGKFLEFSNTIQKSTEEALQEAFKDVILKDKENFENANPQKTYKYPIRPIVIGGDDVTFIIRADLALDFTKIFLEEFENKTKENFNSLGFDKLKNGLSACAGIAYIKESYPLYYGLELAEELTSEAKKMVKDKENFPQNGNIPFSSLSFMKVEDSFVESLKEMKKRNKVASQSGIDYNYGPYTIAEIKKGVPHLKSLKDDLQILENQSTKESKGVSKLRQLISESFKSRDRMDFMLKRMKTVNNDLYKNLRLENGTEKLLDIIQLHSFKY